MSLNAQHKKWMSWTSQIVSLVPAIAFLFTGQASAGVYKPGNEQAHENIAEKYNKTVGQVIVNDATGSSFTGKGSGTLIGKRFVLTAAHVVADASNMSFFINGRSYQAQHWTVHRSYTGVLGINQGPDLAIIELDRNVNGAKVAKIAKTKNIQGRDITLAGYGSFIEGNAIDENDGDDPEFVGPFRPLRAGHNKIEGFTKIYGQTGIYGGANRAKLNFYADMDGWLNNTSDTQFTTDDIGERFEYGLAPGDSGGPAFLGSGMEILGVASYGIWDFADSSGIFNYGSDSWWINATKYRKWSKKWIKRFKRANNPGSTIAATDYSNVYDPTNPFLAPATAFQPNANLIQHLALDVPEPSSLLLITGAITAFATRRRR